MFDIGNENKFLKSITDNILRIKSPGQSIDVSGSDVTMHDLFNVDPEFPAHFYYYKGSLTTPPCSPIVQWHILKKRMQLSQAQYDKLAYTLEDTEHKVVYSNYRDPFKPETPVYECPGNAETIHNWDWKDHIKHSDDDSGDD